MHVHLLCFVCFVYHNYRIILVLLLLLLLLLLLMCWRPQGTASTWWQANRWPGRPAGTGTVGMHPFINESLWMQNTISIVVNIFLNKRIYISYVYIAYITHQIPMSESFVRTSAVYEKPPVLELSVMPSVNGTAVHDIDGPPVLELSVCSTALTFFNCCNSKQVSRV